jgi:hypothetical protein
MLPLEARLLSITERERKKVKRPQEKTEQQKTGKENNQHRKWESD